MGREVKQRWIELERTGTVQRNQVETFRYGDRVLHSNKYITVLFVL